MDIILIGEKSIRVKGKNASVVINPVTGISKTEAEGIVITENYPDFSDSKIEGSRITIKGPGEYEVGGIKISLIPAEGKAVARLNVDNVSVIIGSGSSIEKIKDKIEGSNIVVFNAESEFNYSSLSSLEASVIIAYGKLREEVGKSLGKEVVSVSKFSTTADKLPTEMQFVILS